MLTPVKTEQFTWVPASRTFVAEISDFGKGFKFQQIYPDACDVGIALLSQRTGQQAVYYLNKQVVREGELVAWEFLPTQETVLRVIGASGTKVVIYND